MDPDLDSHGYAFIPPGSGSEEKLEDKNRKKARTLVEIEILFLKVKQIWTSFLVFYTFELSFFFNSS